MESQHPAMAMAEGVGDQFGSAPTKCRSVEEKMHHFLFEQFELFCCISFCTNLSYAEVKAVIIGMNKDVIFKQMNMLSEKLLVF